MPKIGKYELSPECRAKIGKYVFHGTHRDLDIESLAVHFCKNRANLDIKAPVVYMTRSVGVASLHCAEFMKGHASNLKNYREHFVDLEEAINSTKPLKVVEIAHNDPSLAEAYGENDGYIYCTKKSDCLDKLYYATPKDKTDWLYVSYSPLPVDKKIKIHIKWHRKYDPAFAAEVKKGYKAVETLEPDIDNTIYATEILTCKNSATAMKVIKANIEYNTATTADTNKTNGIHVIQYGTEGKDALARAIYEFYLKRLSNHVDIVKAISKNIADEFSNEWWVAPLVQQVEQHDIDKLKDANTTGSFAVYHTKKYGPKELTDLFNLIDNDSDIKDTTTDHILNNKHHPEHWVKDYTSNQRIAPVTMDEPSLAEMCADWMAVSVEKKSKAIDWFNKVCNKSYDFTNSQKTFIKRILAKEDKLKTGLGACGVACEGLRDSIAELSTGLKEKICYIQLSSITRTPLDFNVQTDVRDKAIALACKELDETNIKYDPSSIMQIMSALKFIYTIPSDKEFSMINRYNYAKQLVQLGIPPECISTTSNINNGDDELKFTNMQLLCDNALGTYGDYNVTKANMEQAIQQLSKLAHIYYQYLPKIKGIYNSRKDHGDIAYCAGVSTVYNIYDSSLKVIKHLTTVMNDLYSRYQQLYVKYVNMIMAAAAEQESKEVLTVSTEAVMPKTEVTTAKIKDDMRTYLFG